MNSISIVKGNEARVIVNLTRILATSTEELPLEVSEVKDLRVRLIPRSGASVSLAANVYSENSVIVKVPVLPCGTYSMEVTGERNLMRIASRELCVLRVVYDNSLATVPSGEIEGSKSYDIDMTMVLYTNEVYQVDEEVTEDGKNTPRTSAVYKTIQMYGEAAQQAAEELNVMHENISKLAEDVSDVVESEEERAKAEEERVKAESARVQAETDRVNEFAALKSASEKATTSANSAASAANRAASAAEAATTTANENEQARVNAEAERVKAETARAKEEAARAKAETSRANAESARVKAETDRTNAWAAWFDNATTGVKALWNTWFDNVKSLWGALKSDVDNATNLAVEAAENANNSANHPPYVGEDLYWYVWNNSTKTYDKTDKYSKGDGFSITKTFSSVTEMNAYVNPSTATTENPILKSGDFVLISSDVEDEDNSKLYVVTSVTSTKISYGFLTDMSGVRGFTGHTPQLSIGTITTGAAGTLANVSLTENGTDANGNPKYLVNFVIPKGDKGDAFTYDDFTDEQIAGLQKPATDAAAVALSAAETANDKATLADNAATNANEKATLANTATTKANTAAENANDKAILANDAATTVNALVDAWVQTNPVAGMSRIDGDSDPAAETLYGSAQVREIGKHLRLKVVKDGKVVKTAAAGRLTTATNGDDIAIDGTEGDIMLGFDCNTYLLKASEEIDSVKHNMMGVSLAPASWQGHVSKKFKPWAITPCETVVAQLSGDARSQAHCIYNTSVAGSFGTPTDFFNEKLYTNGGGLRSVGVSGISVIQAAQAKNTDAATCVPYMGSYYEFEEFMRVMMYSECGTKNTTAKNLFGCGCTITDPTSSSTFYDTAISADSGIKIITTGGAESYLNICGSIKLNSSAKASWALYGLNSQVYNFIPNLEEQRLLDGIAKAGLVSHIGNYLAVFSYDASGNVVVTTDGSVNPATGSGMTAGKRYYVVRGVPGCEGMADGVMTAVINCYVKLTCKSGVCDASGIDISGASVIFKFSLGIYRGWSIPMRGTFRFIAGMAYTIQNNGGTYKDAFYCCERPEDMQPLTNTTIYGVIGTEFNALKGMRKFITDGIAFGTGWAKNADYNFSLFCYIALGGDVHTYECAYIWKDYCWGQGTNGRPADGYVCVNAAFGGCHEYAGDASASTLNSSFALSDSNGIYAGAFAAYPLADA